VIPSQFDYVRATSVDHAVTLLKDDAKLIAGGHSLLPLMKLRLSTPSVLVDISELSDLSYIREDDHHIAIGALTKHHDLEGSDLLREQVPILRHAAHEVGDPQVRHRGTIGGSLAHGDPASDLPAVLIALRATLVTNEREIAIDDFFTGFLETALAPNEILTEIRVPKGAVGWSFQKFHRRAQDWAIVGVACVRTNGTAGIGLVNMASTPMRAAAAEAAFAAGSGPADAAAVADEGTSPTSDLNATPDYRRHLARVLVRRALEEATG
jgi:carbon-monoxide dehydrogenase medium subunit